MPTSVGRGLAVATSTNALPVATFVATLPIKVNVALAPLARSTPVQANACAPRSLNAVPPTELTSTRGVNPPSNASLTVTPVAGDGPSLVTVTV